jgi:hypothetical protein
MDLSVLSSETAARRFIIHALETRKDEIPAKYLSNPIVLSLGGNVDFMA